MLVREMGTAISKQAILMTEDRRTPNKTIYVSDADLPIFERAQELAGENLSATIAQALRRFITAEEARAGGLGEIILKVGNHGTYSNKAFVGRELARRRERDAERRTIVSQNVYATAKGRLVLYTRILPGWYYWMSYWDDEGRSPRRSSRRHEVDVDVDADVDVGSGAQADWTRHRPPAWKQGRHHQGQQHHDWSEWLTGNEYRMDIFESLDDLKPHVAEELYTAVAQVLKGDDVEFLDI